VQRKVSLFLIAFTTLFSVTGRCQGRFLTFGGGLTSASLVDKGFSPLAFSGMQGNGLIAYQNSRNNKEKIRQLSFSAGNLQNRFGRDLSAFTISFTEFTFYKGNGDLKRLFWGWSNNNSFNNRVIPDFLNFNGRANYFTSFGPAAKYLLPLQFKDQQFNFQLISHIQLLGFFIPSGYLSSLPAGFNEPQQGFIRSVYHSAFIFHPGNALNIGLWPQAQWKLKSGNNLSINYIYDYTSFSKIHASRKSQGSWLLTLSTRL
jgi:hypothetical protein